MIVVTGATGNVGRPLTQALAAAGEQVTAVSRDAGPVPDGVRHVAADLAEPTSLAAALTGAKALFLLLSGDLHAPGARPADIIALAAARGVGRVVLLSSQGVATRPLGPSRIAMRAVEDALRGSGLDWAVVRPGGFASNALAWAESVRTRGTVAAPFGDVGVPVVDPADIAEVAAACLLDDRHTGRVYELTGPA
ncbi:SDR family oxidoreductase, partial [Kitasatospora sp. MBT63]|uniref:SDR family oxidoreductase n=1 Tax=Kitasatospora sp. MBT63 TaxID=1444768 RepID=UPI00053BB635